QMFGHDDVGSGGSPGRWAYSDSCLTSGPRPGCVSKGSSSRSIPVVDNEVGPVPASMLRRSEAAIAASSSRARQKNNSTTGPTNGGGGAFPPPLASRRRLVARARQREKPAVHPQQYRAPLCELHGPCHAAQCFLHPPQIPEPYRGHPEIRHRIRIEGERLVV